MKIASIVFVFVVFAYLAYTAYETGFTFLNRQQITTTDVNSACFSQDADKRPSFCDIGGAKKMQFKKFIWFVTDGWPAKHADNLFAFYQDHTIVFHVDVPGAKYSHAIYTSWQTGQLPTNYQGKPITGDNLLASMKRSPVNYKIQYSGPEWSFLAITGKDKYAELYDKVTIEHEPLDTHFDHAYPWFFEKKETQVEFRWKFLPELVTNNRSLIAHSAIFDHAQHGVYRNHGDPRYLNPYANTIAKDMQSMKEFIDENPEYLLLVTSDHGTDEYLLSGYVMHGSSEKGNNGFILLYNPNLPAGIHKQMIDIVDVCPTISMYFSEVDIPLNSVGVSKAWFGASNLKSYAMALKRNIHQLKSNLLARGMHIKFSEIEQLLEKAVDVDVVAELRTMAETLKYKLYNTIIPPWNNVILFSIIGAACFLLIHTGIHVIPSKSSALPGILTAFVLFALYFSPTINLLIPWPTFGKVFRSGTSFFLPGPILGLVLLFGVMLQLLSMQNSAHSNTAEKFVEAPQKLFELQKEIMMLCFSSEVLNWFVLAFSLIFKQTWKMALRDFFLSKDITYLICIVVLVKIFRNQLSKDGKTGQRITKFPFWMLFLCRLFEFTEEAPLYFMYEFHFFFALIAIIGIPIFIKRYIIGGVSFDAIVLLLSFVMWMLWMDSSAGRLLLILYNLQHYFLLVPLLRKVDQLRSVIASSTSLNKNPTVRWTCQVLFHAAICYFINQTYFHFHVALGDRVNLNVHPYVGKTGMRSFDIFPILSGFWMGYHKYGLFGIVSVYAWICIKNSKGAITEPITSAPDSKSSLASSIALKIRSGLLKVFSHWSALQFWFLIYFVLYFTISQLGINSLLCFYQSGVQPYEEGTCFVALTAIALASFLVIWGLSVVCSYTQKPSATHGNALSSCLPDEISNGNFSCIEECVNPQNTHLE